MSSRSVCVFHNIPERAIQMSDGGEMFEFVRPPAGTVWRDMCWATINNEDTFGVGTFRFAGNGRGVMTCDYTVDPFDM